RLAPLYDILSAYPLLGGQGWHHSDIRMAMSLKSTVSGRKKLWHKINIAHFLATAKEAGFSENEMKQIIEEFADTVSLAIDRAQSKLPNEIDQQVRDQIFEGIMKTSKKLC
ncbi:MAG: hypothetical protein Q4G42_05715, partial [Neisseria sp.]|nr:hypothetical protein [Neisseria sp.]